MNKRVALCNQLNMNFEEANELFDNESLESMQMARVNGGTDIGAFINRIRAMIELTPLLIICSLTYTEKEIPKDGPTPSMKSESDLKELFNNLTPGSTVTCDSIIDNKWYNLKIEFGTPTPDK